MSGPGPIGPKSPSPATPAIPVGGPPLGTDLPRVSESKGRATPKGPSFGTVLAAAKPILKGAEAAASVLPGGPLVSAAVKAPVAMAKGGAGGMPMSSGGPMPSTGTPFVPHTTIGTPGKGSLEIAAPSPTPAEPGAEHGSIESVLQDSQAFNLYYLQLQEEISAENRGYTALSNVLKARHDTVKNAIGNIR